MQTPAERKLIEVLRHFVARHQGQQAELLNIGAGKSLVIENHLIEGGGRLVCDRVDIADCQVQHPTVRHCYRCSVESMGPVCSDSYDAAFSNYLLEHVVDLDKAASEIARVLRPGGLYVASVPNPKAVEFAVARCTPFWFHKLVRGGPTWPTCYAYDSVEHLCRVFEGVGFRTVGVHHYSCLQQYTRRLPGFGALGALYDWGVETVGWKRCMGNVCIVFCNV